MIRSVEEFIRLRTSDDPENYRRASTEEASDDVWLAIIKGYPEHRRWVAQNKTVSKVILASLAHDGDPEVRWTVASRRTAPPEVLALLATDSDETVRHRVARNPNVPSGVLQLLAGDQSPTVRGAAVARLEAM